MDYLAFVVTIQFMYLVCFLIGLFYAIVAGVLTGFFGGHEGAVDADAGGVDLDAGGHVDIGGGHLDVGGHGDIGGGHLDVGGHGDVGGGHLDVGGTDVDAGGPDVDAGGVEMGAAGAEAVDAGQVQFSPLSPIVIAMFLTAFGGAGLIVAGPLKMSGLISVPISVVAGFAVAAGTFGLFYKLVQVTQASSEATVSTLIGEAGEVTVAIPRDGLGEIAYVARGSRYTAAARSASGTTIAVHTPVIIRRIVGSTFYVAPRG